MDISIIIVNYFSEHYLKDCISSILESFKKSPLSFEIIIVDNSATQKKLVLNIPDNKKVYIVENDKNRGFSQANNYGTTYAKGEYLFFLNPDTIVEKMIFAKLFDFFKRAPGAGIVGPLVSVGVHGKMQMASCGRFPTLTLNIADAFSLNKFISLPFFPPRPFVTREEIPDDGRVDWITGACLGIQKKLFDSIGGFDEKIFMYYEDADICYRVKNKGFNNYICPDVSVMHFGGEISKYNPKAVIRTVSGFYYFLSKHLGMSRAVISIAAYAASDTVKFLFCSLLLSEKRNYYRYRLKGYYRLVIK